MNLIQPLAPSFSRRRWALGLAVLLVVTGANPAPASGRGPAALATQLDVGYLDFSYSDPAVDNPTFDKPESKLWWNDGFWWGILYNAPAAAFHIYRLNWSTQTWEDTGTLVDAKARARFDALWDASLQKLYVTSHIYTHNPDPEPIDPQNWGRVYRFNYEAASETYHLDSGFPVAVNQDRTESLVLAQDSVGRLWTTYTSKPYGSVIISGTLKVFVNVSADGGVTWGTPFLLPGAPDVSDDDLSTIVAFRDDSGEQIGIMWSDQLSGRFYFGTHPDSVSDTQASWTITAIPGIPYPPDDHINLKARRTSTSGQLFAAVKLNTPDPAGVRTGLITRDTDGTFSFRPYSLEAGLDTRPMAVIDEASNTVYVFVSGKGGGGKLCYKASTITAPLSAMTFNLAPNVDCGFPFIEDDVYKTIDGSTASKHNVNGTTGLVVLATDNLHDKVYVHNVMGDPPPVVVGRSPAPGATGVVRNPTIVASFSVDMDPVTINDTSVSLSSSAGSVAGIVGYSTGRRAAVITPNAILEPETVYTVTLAASLTGANGKPLWGAPETWSFTTGTAITHYTYLPWVGK